MRCESGAVRRHGVQREAQRRALRADRRFERLAAARRARSPSSTGTNSSIARTGGQPSPWPPSAPMRASRSGALDQRLGRAGRGEHAAPAGELEAVVPAVAAQRGDVAQRRLGRIQAAQIGGHRDRAAARVAVAEPAPDAVEDAARRVGQVQQHVLGRLGRLELRRHEPGLEPLARALGELVRSRAARRSRSVRRPRRRRRRRARGRACRRCARARPRAPRRPASSTPALRERRHAADHAEREPVPHGRTNAARRAGAAPRARARRRARGSRCRSARARRAPARGTPRRCRRRRRAGGARTCAGARCSRGRARPRPRRAASG